MQGSEALTRLIAMADCHQAADREDSSQLDEDSLFQFEQDELALSICQAMLNTAIPLARFRAHVSVEEVTGRTKFGLGEFTVSATNIDGIKLGLSALSMEGLKVHATLWEQRATGADMLSGYQGFTKTLQFRNWLKQIDTYETSPTVQ